MKIWLVALLVLPIPVFADGGVPNEPYIYVEGKVEIESPADIATLRFDLVARNADQKKANQEVQANATRVLALLNEKKIAQTDVVATDVKSEPQYEADEGSRTRGALVGYSVTRRFTVRLRNTADLPKLIDDLLAVGGTEFEGIEAGLSKQKEVEDEAWDKAIANARERAEKTLKTTGMKIGSIFAVSPVSFSEIHQKMFGFGGGTTDIPAEGPAAPDPLHYRLAPVSVSQSVHVIYLLTASK